VACALLLIAGAATAEDDGRGEQLYALCAQCHGAEGQGNSTVLAPNIAGLAAWYVQGQLVKFRSGWRGLHPEDTGGMRMRPMSQWLRSDEDVAAVSAYVASLPKVKSESELAGGDVTRGQALYGPCIACHAVDGSGNEALQGPALTHTGDWYLLTQLGNFKAGIRGANPEDAQGGMMRGMVNTLADEQAMRDVLAYIQTLGSSE
jgi:cytochrome c553